ncbi:MAG: DUF29 domain-containing protein [Deltaproteobacteria bacterium]|nr:DUF29 domain-containing protein [Deltaproteobacteria bacterium]
MRNPSSDLYGRDYYAWLQDQVRALRERRVEDVDWENVAEEIESLGKSERRGIRSHVATVVEQLLKLQYARGIFREYSARGWRVSIRSARRQIQELLDESPSLRPQLAEMLVRAYGDGRIEALRERTLKENILPKTSPWTVEQVMDDAFLPDRAATTRD